MNKESKWYFSGVEDLVNSMTNFVRLNIQVAVILLVIPFGSFSLAHDFQRFDVALYNGDTVVTIIELLENNEARVITDFSESPVNMPKTLPLSQLVPTLGRNNAELVIFENQIFNAFAYFPDGVVFIGNRSSGRKIVNTVEVTPIKPAGDYFAISADGSLQEVVGTTEHSIVKYGDNGYEVSPKGQVALIKWGDLFETYRKWLGPYFDEISMGRQVDLTDSFQRWLFLRYIEINMTTGVPDSEAFLSDSLSEVDAQIKKHSIPEKVDLPLVRITNSSGRTLQLRRLGVQEASFRGCLGKDCSTRTRLLRALEPGHLHFAIESVPFRPLGQIEIVLGTDPETGTKLAFLERIQSPKKLRPAELSALISGLQKVLSTELGTTLVILKNLKMYDQFGHPISNYQVVTKGLEVSYEKHFRLGPSLRFKRKNDAYIEGEERRFPRNLIASRVEESKAEVLVVEVDSSSADFPKVETVSRQKTAGWRDLSKAKTQITEDIKRAALPIESNESRILNYMMNSMGQSCAKVVSQKKVSNF